jgi:hypothetical protein
MVLGGVQVDITNLDITFRTKFLCVGFKKTQPIPSEMSSESYRTSDMMSKNDVLMYILMYFCQRSGGGSTLLLSFTAITDHPSAGEVPPGYGPQSNAVPVRIPIIFWSLASQSAGGGRFPVWPALPPLFLSGQLALHSSRHISETVALYYTLSKYGGR